MALKLYKVEANFPAAVGHHAWQEAHAQAGTLRVAVGRALAAICRRPGIKGKRLRLVKLTVMEVGKAEPAAGKTPGGAHE